MGYPSNCASQPHDLRVPFNLQIYCDANSNSKISQLAYMADNCSHAPEPHMRSKYATRTQRSVLHVGTWLHRLQAI
jgi:hypothetical protein